MQELCSSDVTSLAEPDGCEMTTSDSPGGEEHEPTLSRNRFWDPGSEAREWLLVGISGVLGVVFYVINLTIGHITGQPWAASDSPGAIAVAIFLLIVQALALLWRRKRPLVMFGAGYLVFIVLTVVQGDRDLAAGPILWIAVFFLAANTSARVTIPALLAAAACDVTIQLPWLMQTQGLMGTLWLVTVSVVIVKVAVVYTICAFFGAWMTLQRRRAELATERTALIQKESESRVREALVRERNRMARELHDVAAHHLSGIAVQSQAALHVHPNEPETVGELLRDIREQSKDTLSSLRQIVGILRECDDQDLSPQPMIEDVSELVDSIRRLSTVVDLHVEGDSIGPAPAVSLACYRVVQESLSNAQKHAAGTDVSVRIQNRGEQVKIVVENGKPTSAPVSAAGIQSGGFGLTGMRERVQILGGHFEAGPTGNGGWRNTAIIPIREGTVVQ